MATVRGTLRRPNIARKKYIFRNFKHFEIELRRDSGRSSLTGSKESGLDSCFIDNCNHKNYPKTVVDGDVDELTGGVMV